MNITNYQINTKTSFEKNETKKIENISTKTQTNANSKDYNRSKIATIIRTLCGLALGFGLIKIASTKMATKTIYSPISKLFKLNNKNIDIKILDNATNKVLKTNKLEFADIIDLSKDYKKLILNRIKNSKDKNPEKTFASLEKTLEYLKKNSDGKAHLLAGRPTVLINKKIAGGLVFHELGHIKSLTSPEFKNLFKKLDKTGSVSEKIQKYLPLAVLLVPPPKKIGEKESLFSKIGNPVKNIIGIITFLTFTPKFINESLANIQGVKIFKNIKNKLPENEFKYLSKKINRNILINTAGFLLHATIIGAIAYFAARLKDKIAQGKTN